MQLHLELHWWIQIVEMIPDVVIFFMFIVLLYFRVIEDYYLRKSIYFFVGNMIFDILKNSFLIAWIYMALNNKDEKSAEE